MNLGDPGARLWPLAATLGAAASAANATQQTLRDVTQQLGRLCSADVALWEPAGEAGGVAARWRLRIGQDGAPAPLPDPGGRAAADLVAQAAATVRVISAGEPVATLALPILAFGRVLGVLQMSATGPDRVLARWRPDLEGFVPVLGLYLQAAEANEALSSGLLRDQLTGLANRPQMRDHLDRELARAKRSQRTFALLLIAVDRYDSLGGELGLPLRDQLVQSLAMLLRDACRNGDIIGRYDADRFLILLPDSTSRGAHTAAHRYLARLYRRPITFPEGAQRYLDVSIGIGVFPVDGASADELVESTATALREAQRLGGMRAVAA